MPVRQHNWGSWSGQKSYRQQLRWGVLQLNLNVQITCGRVWMFDKVLVWPCVLSFSFASAILSCYDSFLKETAKSCSWKESFCFQSCGMQSNELGKVLHLLGMKNKRLVNLSHLLEFITWSLLKENSTVSPANVFQMINQHF